MSSHEQVYYLSTSIGLCRMNLRVTYEYTPHEPASANAPEVLEQVFVTNWEKLEDYYDGLHTKESFETFVLLPKIREQRYEDSDITQLRLEDAL
jgi:hypothetical protein